MVIEYDLCVSNGLCFGAGILYPNSVLSLYIVRNGAYKWIVLYPVHGPENIRSESSRNSGLKSLVLLRNLHIL